MHRQQILGSGIILGTIFVLSLVAAGEWPNLCAFGPRKAWGFLPTAFRIRFDRPRALIHHLSGYPLCQDLRTTSGLPTSRELTGPTRVSAWTCRRALPAQLEYPRD